MCEICSSRYHDAQTALDMAIGAFAAGYMPLDQRSIAEDFFWAICRKRAAEWPKNRWMNCPRSCRS